MSAISHYIHATYDGFLKDSSYDGITLAGAEMATYKAMKSRFRKAAWNQITIRDPETFKQWEKDSRQKDKIINQILNSIGKGVEDGYSEIFNQYQNMVKTSLSTLQEGLYNQTDTRLKAESINKTVSLLNDWYSYLHNKEMTVFRTENGKIVLGPNSGGVIDAVSLQPVADAINKLIERSNGIGDALKADSVKGSLSKNFGENLGEAAGGYAMAKAFSHGLEEANNYFQSLGKENVKIDTKELQELQKKFGQKGEQKYKADISYSNIKTQIKVNNETVQVIVDIPSTVKSYIGEGFNSPKMATDASLGRRLNQALSLKALSKKHVLYAYNLLAVADQSGDRGVKDIKNIVAAGTADQLISGFGFGTNDTSLLLLASGRIYNVYELLLQKSNIDKIRIDFDLSKVEAIQERRRAEKPSQYKALKGSKDVYKALDNTNFEAHWNLGRILSIKS